MCVCVCVFVVMLFMLTQCNLGQMQPVDPGDLTEGVGSVEDHHEADGTSRPTVRRGHVSTDSL